MGKTEQLPGVGVAQLELASTCLNAGDTLRGVVRVKLDKAVPDAMISVQITGTERLQWVNVTQSFDKRYHTKSHDHFCAELFLGGVNASLAPGHHEFPFELPLPSDLIANAHIRSIHRLFVYDMRNVFTAIQYAVSATVESAGLTNEHLQSRAEFFVGSTPVARPVAPIRAECTETIKRFVVGHRQPCTLRLERANNVFELPNGTIDVVVEITMPATRTLQTVELGLLEKVCVDRGDGEKDGRYREDERVVCAQKYAASVFAEVEGTPHTMRARLDMRIDDPRRQAAGGAVTASRDSRFVRFRHAITVKASLGIGSTVTLTTPVVLVYAVPVALPVAADHVGMTVP